MKAGSYLDLNPAGSSDPDGNKLIYQWSVYQEPGSYKGDVNIEGTNTEKCKIHIPDEATPALTVYRRVVLNIS